MNRLDGLIPDHWTTGAPFRPRLGFGSALVQTAWPALPIWAGSIASVRRLVPIEGGGALHLHLTMRPTPGPLVLLVHGLGGSSDSVYVRRSAEALLAEGFHVARLDLRGAGESLFDAPSLYHAGLAADLARAAETAAAEKVVTSVSLMGFSLGGNVVLKLAGEWGDAPPGYAQAAVAISSLVNLGPAAAAFERPQALPYRVYVMRKLVASARAYCRTFPDRDRHGVAALRSLSTIREYDHHFVAPMHGFASADDYYDRASSGPGLARVSLPTLVTFAADDPMIPASTVLHSLRNASSRVDVAWSARGGHVGGFETLSRESLVRTWPVVRAISFLREKAL